MGLLVSCKQKNVINVVKNPTMFTKIPIAIRPMLSKRGAATKASTWTSKVPYIFFQILNFYEVLMGCRNFWHFTIIRYSNQVEGRIENLKYYKKIYSIQYRYPTLWRCPDTNSPNRRSWSSEKNKWSSSTPFPSKVETPIPNKWIKDSIPQSSTEERIVGEILLNHG